MGDCGNLMKDQLCKVPVLLFLSVATGMFLACAEPAVMNENRSELIDGSASRDRILPNANTNERNRQQITIQANTFAIALNRG